MVRFDSGERERMMRAGFNGSTVGEPWLGLQCRESRSSSSSFNGSTVGEPWLGIGTLQWIATYSRLQWVHGRRTVVRLMLDVIPTSSELSFNGSTVGEPWLGMRAGINIHSEPVLQWVHGRRTVVRGVVFREQDVSFRASMGPRSENRG